MFDIYIYIILYIYIYIYHLIYIYKMIYIYIYIYIYVNISFIGHWYIIKPSTKNTHIFQLMHSIFILRYLIRTIYITRLEKACCYHYLFNIFNFPIKLQKKPVIFVFNAQTFQLALFKPVKYNNNNIIDKSICLRRIYSNKTIQRQITLYRNIDYL